MMKGTIFSFSFHFLLSLFVLLLTGNLALNTNKRNTD